MISDDIHSFIFQESEPKQDNCGPENQNYELKDAEMHHRAERNCGFWIHCYENIDYCCFKLCQNVFVSCWPTFAFTFGLCLISNITNYIRIIFFLWEQNTSNLLQLHNCVNKLLHIKPAEDNSVDKTTIFKMLYNSGTFWMSKNNQIT